MQYSQFPHAGQVIATTLSPGLNRLTPVPTATTSPAASLPS